MSESGNEGADPYIHWTPLLEKYFADTAEQAHCLSWCHKESEALYSFRTSFIDIPVIILSIFNGAVSVGSSTLFGDDTKSASVGVGVMALVTASMSAVSSYFGWARRSEGHKQSAIEYAKLYRFLSVEMGLPRHERICPNKLVKMVRQDVDKLAQTSPIIPELIKQKFKDKFKDIKNVSFPPELNGLEEVVIYVPTKDTDTPDQKASSVSSAFSVRRTSITSETGQPKEIPVVQTTDVAEKSETISE